MGAGLVVVGDDDIQQYPCHYYEHQVLSCVDSAQLSWCCDSKYCYHCGCHRRLVVVADDMKAAGMVVASRQYRCFAAVAVVAVDVATPAVVVLGLRIVASHLVVLVKWRLAFY